MYKITLEIYFDTAQERYRKFARMEKPARCKGVFAQKI